MLLSYEEFQSERKRERKLQREATRKVELQIEELIEKQRNVLEGLGLQKNNFERAFEQAEYNSHVLEAVRKAEELSTEIGQLTRAEKFLIIVVRLEQLKKEITMTLIEKEDFKEAITLLAELRQLEIDSSFKGLNDYSTDCQSWACGLIDSCLKKRFLNQLEELGWPKQPIDASIWDGSKTKSVLSLYDDYLMLASAYNDSNSTLRAVDAMIEPIRVRFHFHFSTDQPTNRLDKPEWYLNHILQIISTHRLMISGCFEIETLDGKSNGLFLQTFINRLADIVKEHVVGRETRILQDPFILLHTVSELLIFISAIQEQTGVDCSRIVSAFFGPHLMTWMNAEKEATFTSYEGLMEDDGSSWILEELQNNDSISSFINGFIELIDDCIKTLHLIPMMHAKIDFLSIIIVALFSRVYEKVEFEIPTFHATSEDVKILILQANSIIKLTDDIGARWGESLESIALAGSSEFSDTFGYNATGLPGTIFNRTLSAFRDLLDRIHDNLFSYFWDSFHTPASSYVRSMHYGVLRDPKYQITMHDDLRKALVCISESHAILKSLLNPTSLDQIETRLIETLGIWLYDRLLLQNYFRDAFIPQFISDLTLIEITIKKLVPRQPVSLAMRKANEAGRILSMQIDARDHLWEMIKTEELDQVANILGSLQVTLLSVSSCEKILSLIRT